MICTPRAQAAKNLDSLRALPLVREMLAGSRQEARALTLQLTRTQAQTAQANNALLVSLNEAALWKAKAKRRGLIIGVGVAVPAALGLYTILK
ncbi:hypothetical protein LJ737_20655 [Hymenobacter sp. 15J16-1T3B]|uniref:hypothetical protein n=1 Tax=Hymenobacter sp. 15J16-1T3B TaxID=2886941 RepID=UPI001D121F6C|nr:hypothetical protein [Hymenobacter sp. 15J16-1T3B]MCC3159664.1 hypothetical protein [Hymenobacter sp. 15J16-1T3B]